MNIIKEKPKINTVSLSTLNPGDIFRYDTDDTEYIVLKVPNMPVFSDYFINIANRVKNRVIVFNTTNNRLTHSDSSAQVIHVQYDLIIKN